MDPFGKVGRTLPTASHDSNLIRSRTTRKPGAKSMERYCRTVATALCTALLIMLPGLSLSEAAAQGLPDRPIRIIVPAAAGGGVGVIARVLSNKASEILGQTVYVENKPGANCIIGMEYVARAQPDGTTLLLLSG